jgi:thiol:disulfide interchange protein
MGLSRLVCALLGLVLLFAPLNLASAPKQDWNSSVTWRSYEEGLRKAKLQGRPVCLVLYTTWCPHCTAYARMFHDPNVVDASREMVMIRVDTDANPEIAEKYSLDGSYIPRTYFLTPDGSVAKIETGRSKYRFFYDESNPKPLHAAMQRALALAR